MKSFKLFTALFFFCLASLQVAAQESSEMEELDLVTMQVIDIGIQQNTNNAAFVQQLGNRNEARLIQEYGGGQRNVAILSQSGNRNDGYLLQSGSNLNTVAGQNGNSNMFNIWSVGNNIQTNVRQNGNNNTIDSYIENYSASGKNAELLQNGNNNRIELSLRGDGFSGSDQAQFVRISQTGNNFEAVANMDAYSAPFEITQTPGIGGEGMQVNVSTSQFNFPMRR